MSHPTALFSQERFSKWSLVRTGNRGESLVTFLEQSGEEVVAVWHSLPDEMLNALIALLPQFSRNARLSSMSGSASPEMIRVAG